MNCQVSSFFDKQLWSMDCKLNAWSEVLCQLLKSQKLIAYQGLPEL